jgi:hypothetical protein
MRTLLFASALSLAFALAACEMDGRPAADSKPGGAADHDADHDHDHHPHAPKPLTGLPTWEDGDGDMAAAAVALAKVDDLEHFRKEVTTAEARQKRSESAFQNVMVLDGMTSERFVAAMGGMARALDVRCPFCHDPQNFASDEKNEKKGARGMLLAAQRINTDFFHGKTAVTCWTCHRGEEKPGKPQDFMEKIKAVKLPPGMALPPDDPKVTAGSYYKNLQKFNTMPASHLLTVMQAFSAALGKECSFCHDPAHWESDEKHEKQAARRMFDLASHVNAQFFGSREDDDAVNCWTCHRGQEKPETAPAE